MREADREMVNPLDEDLNSILAGAIYSRPHLRSSAASLGEGDGTYGFICMLAFAVFAPFYVLGLDLRAALP